ncbi:MAG: NlpC/P60 family protein [Nocardioides sp.]
MSVRSPRALRVAIAAFALTCAGAAVATTGIAGAVDDVPSAEEVAAAEAEAASSADDVAEVQRRLAAARAQLDAVTIRTAQLSEAYNGARYRLQRAQVRADEAEQKAAAANAEADKQLASYRDALVTSYQLAPELQAWSAIVSSTGIEQVVERSATLEVAEGAMGARYDDLEAARAAAKKASAAARDARRKADSAADRAKAARDAAMSAQAQAEASMAELAGEEQALIERWAELEGISIALAEQRSDALAEEEPETETPQASAPAEPEETRAPNPSPTTATPGHNGSPSQAPTKNPPPPPTPSDDPTSATPDPEPSTDPDPPAPASGAQRAIAFARDQIGEPYRWGAAGPNAWDCSGLTMGAWSAGGKSLPHYSVAQYQQSTPISRSQLQPGDLVFWGSSSRATSIYHVALYVGNGRIIHAPRTGRPVAEESIDYWIPPNFFARP